MGPSRRRGPQGRSNHHRTGREHPSSWHLADSALHAPAASFGGHDAYPDLIDKAAVLGWHLANNHPLPDGNKRCAFITMIVFLKRNTVGWHPPDVDDAVATMLAVASKTLDVDGLAAWLKAHTTR